MGAKNITSEKMDTSGFAGGGYSAPTSEGGGKSARVLTKASAPLTAASRGKGPFGGKESKNTAAGRSPGKYKG